MFDRLYPDHATGLTADAVASGLDLAARAPSDRPYLVLNMAATADGRIAIDGRSAPVAGSADRALFHELRTQADAVMAGAGTVRVERYRRITKTDELTAKREREGTAPVPLAVFVSGSLDLDPQLPIFQDPESRVAIITRSSQTLPDVDAQVDYLRQTGDELAPALRTLRADFGVRSILCEGGPHLNSALLHDDLVDELFLCISPKITGDGTQLASVEGVKLPEPAALELVSLWEAEQNVFFRYRIAR